MVDYIKSFGREQLRQHKQSAVLRTFNVQSLNFCLEGIRPKETTIQAKLSVQIYKISRMTLLMLAIPASMH